MGVPYSKQIELAFDQVGPFLRTAKYISSVLAAFYVLTILVLGLLLGLILLALVALLITVNPDLEAERRAVVTPVVRRMTRWIADATSTGSRVDIAGQRRGGRVITTEKTK